jgi:hypothetical protein
MPEFPETTVTWELEKIEPNKTRVELTHLGFIRRERNDIPLEEHDKGCGLISSMS